MQNELTHALETLTDEELNNMNDDDFNTVINKIPKLSQGDMKRFMQMMSRHRPGIIEASKHKSVTRKKSKQQKQSRKANRK